MSVLTIGNQSFNYPDPGEEAGWGEDATGWAEAVTTALSALIGTGDILPSTYSIPNNSTNQDVVGLAFNSSEIRSANINYNVYRKSNTETGIAESGVMLLDLNDTGAVGQKWQLTIQKNGEAGVSFSVTDSGQIQVTSSDIGLAGYVGTMRFSAKALSKT